MDWLEYFIGKRKRRPDINKPVPVGDPMKDLRAPLPNEQQPSPASKRRWDVYNLNQRYRRWLTKERRA